MPEGSSKQEAPKDSSSWREALLKAAAEPLQADISAGQQLAHREIQKALDIDASVLSFPQESPEVLFSAKRLAARHQEHFIAPHFIDVVLRIMQNKNDLVAKQELQLMRQRASESGFFIMNYTPQMMAQRLVSPNYFIAEASGRHPEFNHPFNRLSVPAADCQCWLPDAKEELTEMIDLPEERYDEKYEDDLIEAILNRPWAFAEVKDISTSMAMNNRGLAGAARRAAFRHIETVVNPSRGNFPIEYVAASIAMLKGIILPDGTVVTLKEIGEDRGLKNERSIAIHFEAKSYPVTTGYILKNRKVPVEIDIHGERYGILANWLMCFHELKKAD